MANQLASAFRDVVERVIAALAEQIAMMLTEMVAGQATTTALSPILPELLVAYKALQAVNALLDAVGL